jgi:hypothetical protein
MSKEDHDGEWLCNLCGLVFYDKSVDRFAAAKDHELPQYSCENCWNALMRVERSLASKAFDVETVSGIENK